MARLVFDRRPRVTAWRRHSFSSASCQRNSISPVNFIWAARWTDASPRQRHYQLSEKHPSVRSSLCISTRLYRLPTLRTKFGEWAFSFAELSAWNSLPLTLHSAYNRQAFKKLLKTQRSCFSTYVCLFLFFRHTVAVFIYEISNACLVVIRKSRITKSRRSMSLPIFYNFYANACCSAIRLPFQRVWSVILSKTANFIFLYTIYA